MTADDKHGNHGKWLTLSMPHKGWSCIDVVDLGKETRTCEMCELPAAKVRYVHRMKHRDYDGVLECGCYCAGRMEDDSERAQHRENLFKRRSDFIDPDKWREGFHGRNVSRKFTIDENAFYVEIRSFVSSFDEPPAPEDKKWQAYITLSRSKNYEPDRLSLHEEQEPIWLVYSARSPTITPEPLSMSDAKGAAFDDLMRYFMSCS